MRRLLRSLTPPWFIVAMFVCFLVAEGFLQWAERRLGVAVLDFEFRPSLIFLYLAAVTFGCSRAAARHPFFNRHYQDWLTRTPWTFAKPLPFGPIGLGAADVVVLGLLVGLSLLTPEPERERDALRLLCVFIAIHSALLMCANMWTTNRVYAYLSGFGLALMVRLIPHPWACLATGATVYLVSLEGVRQALRAFPWDRSYTASNLNYTMLSDQAIREGKGEPSPCGWPYGALLRDPVVKTPAPETGLDALIWCLLLGWWISCLASRFTEPSDAAGFTGLCLTGVCFVSLISRLGVYLTGCFPPLSVVGRIVTGRLIMPRFDVVFIAPILIILVASAAMAVFMSRLVPIVVYGPIATGFIMFIALWTPPGLKKWRLTGGHRMIPTGPGVTTDHV